MSIIKDDEWQNKHLIDPKCSICNSYLDWDNVNDTWICPNEECLINIKEGQPFTQLEYNNWAKEYLKNH